mmetsp:Transcript_7762/g.18000  ORF Transcript_7762/g.18000 Transcript_7762/m.18000 type:complete len:220 (+) Transcript_7762:543-1202(+)
MRKENSALFSNLQMRNRMPPRTRKAMWAARCTAAHPSRRASRSAWPRSESAQRTFLTTVIVGMCRALSCFGFTTRAPSSSMARSRFMSTTSAALRTWVRRNLRAPTSTTSPFSTFACATLTATLEISSSPRPRAESSVLSPLTTASSFRSGDICTISTSAGSTGRKLSSHLLTRRFSTSTSLMLKRTRTFSGMPCRSPKIVSGRSTLARCCSSWAPTPA